MADTAWPYCLTLPGMPNWVFQPPTICLYGIYLPDRHCYGTVDIYAPAYRIAASELRGAPNCRLTQPSAVAVVAES